LLRAVELEAGSVLLDGVEINTVSVSALRRAIAIVPQQPFVFSGSLRDNLFLSHIACNDDDVIALLQLAGLGLGNSRLHQ
jgi:ABC-type bacteriocin/lantibiotic exporter with double-glycine peptidase domain